CCSSLACASASSSASGLSSLWGGSVCAFCSCMPFELGMGREAFKAGLAIPVKLLSSEFMKKPVKYRWLALGGIAALLAAGILVFALTFAPNRYKDDIQRMAMERTGRTLRLQGELK